MICLLGDFVFNAVNIEKMNSIVEAKWGEYSPIFGNTIYSNTKGYTQKIKIEGTFVNYSNSTISTLEEMAKNKEEIRITFATGISFKAIINVTNLSKKKFISGSGAVIVDFEINLTILEDNFNLIDLLMEELNGLL